jgi:hypothetical protein
MEGGSEKSTIKLTIRLPRSLHERLVQAAEKSDRSLNSEMVNRLRQSLPEQTILDLAIEQAIRRMEEKYGRT